MKMRIPRLMAVVLMGWCCSGLAPLWAKSNGIECSSINFQEQHCPTEARGVIELVEQISRAACDQGRTWGYDEGGIWVKAGCRGIFSTQPGYRGVSVQRPDMSPPPKPQSPVRRPNVSLPADQIAEVYCASFRNRYQHCDADMRGRTLHLVHEFSDQACEYGRTWGYNSRGIWVDRGCVGLFRMKRRFVPPPRLVRVLCESDDYLRVSCPVQRIGHVALRTQLSDSACNRGEGWGLERGAIWVDKGCRALFDVVELGTGLPGWMYGRFKGRDPHTNQHLELEIQTSGTIQAWRDGRHVHADIDGDLLVLGGVTYELAKTRTGMRAENTHSGWFRMIQFRRMDQSRSG